jgi:hypothetical protein
MDSVGWLYKFRVYDMIIEELMLDHFWMNIQIDS